MLNPVLFTEKVLSDFLRYQLTTYAFADPGLYEQMRRLLNLEETRRSPLLRGPYVSLSRSFRRGESVEALVGEGLLHPHMRTLLGGWEHVYGHQETAFRHAGAGRHVLVSTGTGSGKTEAFLVPILDRCLRLRDEGAPEGIVAVILYPMNALAEDQLGRLREMLAGSGIPFGMYTGRTPESARDVAGRRLSPGSSNADYRAALEAARHGGEKHAIHPPEERVTREELRGKGTRPRILLTNARQLELLLTRQKDVEMFDGARLDFLVVDEAHTFRGAQGAEVACLLRRLRSFCGRTPAETTCIATSATLVDPERGEKAARDFAARFFGVAGGDVALVTEEYESDRWADKRYVVPPVLQGDARIHLKNVLDAVEAGDDGEATIRVAYRGLTGRELDKTAGRWREALYDELRQNEVVYRIAELLTKPRAMESLLEDLRKAVGREELAEEEALAWLALGAASRREGRPLLRPVIHAFVRGVEGAVVTFPPDMPRPRLWLSAEDAIEELEGTEAPVLHALPVTNCTTCGQHYFVHHVKDFVFDGARPGGGDASGDERYWQPLDDASGGKRVVLLDRTITSDPEAADETDEGGESEAKENESSGSLFVPGSCGVVRMCRACGTLHEDKELGRCLHCGREGGMVRLLAVRQKEKNPGRLTSCVSCGALGRDRPGNYREPARPVRALTVSDVHVLAQNMIHQAERKRLLVFADSRQDAAFQAGWMQDHARRYRFRGVMYDQLRKGTVGVGDLVARMLDVFDADDELSQSLAPEVWRVEWKKDSPQRHGEQLRQFLRIQVLREIALGLKQRIGLEPWGRLRVSYEGLDPDATFFKEWAGFLGAKPEELLSSVEALLDVLRRKALILDPGTSLFNKLRLEGDFIVQRGYSPVLQGVPKGLKLRRAPGDNESRVEQLLSDRGDTIARQAARRWGFADKTQTFLEDLWKHLEEVRLLVPSTLLGASGPLAKCAGTRQLDVTKLRLEKPEQPGVWRCTTCRRIHARPTLHGACIGWRCKGTTRFETERADDYDLRVLDERFEMLRPKEHSAQVPAGERDILERWFKEGNERLNVLVCTPTLELGVDIGSLDTVLMRNVPPLPANYWQRAGRAGRRHRLAVTLTYARGTSHDRAYFRDPLKLLDGQVSPPRFNMRNAVMAKKHVHAATLTGLGMLARETGPLPREARARVEAAIRECFPRQIRDYLFDGTNLRAEPLNVGRLGEIVGEHEAALLDGIRTAFHAGWPEADAEVVSEDALRAILRGIGGELQSVVGRLWTRLQWALAQRDRLDADRRRMGTLDNEGDALYRRCDRVVKKLKGEESRRRREAEGYDDTNTFAVLATEGFLPGYGLDTGSIVGTAMGAPFGGTPDFELPRPSAMALREYVPGNLIYANGSKFVPRYFHLDPRGSVETVNLLVDVEAQAVVELGAASGTTSTAMNAGSVVAIPICDVDLPQSSQISDEDDNRFQMPVAIYGRERGRHGGGEAYRWGTREVHFRRNVHLRLVNVGEAGLVGKGTLGYPLCLVCGQSRSPLSSDKDREEFENHHLERCGRKVERTAFYSDVVADAVSFPDCADREEGFSLVEALRIGANDILEMESEDLQILAIGESGSSAVRFLLYDPMPGGSGLLDQLTTRWNEVVAAAISACRGCPSACAKSCPDCLQTFRNAHSHRHLNRHVAMERLSDLGDALVREHAIPSMQGVSDAESIGSLPTNPAEDRLLALLRRAGFQEPIAQKEIDLGSAWGRTVPDFFYPPPHETSEGICLYLDGMSRGLHGDPKRAEADLALRAKLEELGYDVRPIPRGHLDDRLAMIEHFAWLARKLMGRERAEKIRADPSWWE